MLCLQCLNLMVWLMSLQVQEMKLKNLNCALTIKQVDLQISLQTFT